MTDAARTPDPFAHLGDREPTEEELRGAFAKDPETVKSYFAIRVVEGAESTAEGVADLEAYRRDFDLSSVEDLVDLWDLRWGLHYP